MLRAGPVGPVGSGQAVIEIDPFGRDAELEQGFALRGEVVGIGAAAAVPDYPPTEAGRLSADGS